MDLEQPPSMGLDQLLRLIVESDRGDWNVISCFGLPSYLPWSPEDGEFNEHIARAAYRPDVAIGLAWGIEAQEDYKPDWVEELEKPLGRAAPLNIADVLYTGMVVFREQLVLVDAGRCYLPLPQSGDDMRVGKWNHDFAKLINELSLAIGMGGGLGDASRSEFDDYFRRAGLSI